MFEFLEMTVQLKFHAKVVWDMIPNNSTTTVWAP